MASYLQDTWTNGNYNSRPSCFKGFVNGQNICLGSNYKGTSTTHLTNTLGINYNYNQVRSTESQSNPEATETTETTDSQTVDTTSVFTNTGIHSTTLNYSLETGTVKDSSFENGSKFTFGLGLNGGACWNSNSDIKTPGYTYGGNAYIEQENIWAYGKHANVLGRIRLGANHQGYHFNNQSSVGSGENTIPNYVSTTSAELDLSLAAVRYTHFDVEVGGKVGYEYNKQTLNGETTTFQAPKVGGYISGKVLFPTKRGCPVTPGLTFRGGVDYTLDGMLYNKNSASSGNRLNYQAAGGLVLLF